MTKQLSLYQHFIMSTLFLFFFNDTATTEIYTLSLHDALPISTGMSLSSFVFHLGDSLERFTPSDEVAEAFWVPLRHLLDPRNAGQRPTVRDGVSLSPPAVLYQGHFIWGLTYRVLTLFFEQMDLMIARLG